MRNCVWKKRLEQLRSAAPFDSYKHTFYTNLRRDLQTFKTAGPSKLSKRPQRSVFTRSTRQSHLRLSSALIRPLSARIIIISLQLSVGHLSSRQVYLRPEHKMREMATGKRKLSIVNFGKFWVSSNKGHLLLCIERTRHAKNMFTFLLKNKEGR